MSHNDNPANVASSPEMREGHIRDFVASTTEKNLGDGMPYIWHGHHVHIVRPVWKDGSLVEVIVSESETCPVGVTSVVPVDELAPMSRMPASSAPIPAAQTS